MPSFAPRQEPVKKKNQLLQKEMELVSALRKNLADNQLLKFVDNYRHAKLSLLKAKIHYLKEKEYQTKATSMKIEKVEAEMLEWADKSNESIVDEMRHKVFIDMFCSTI